VSAQDDLQQQQWLGESDQAADLQQLQLWQQHQQ
jgi:hypothetical protein